MLFSTIANTAISRKRGGNIWCGQQNPFSNKFLTW